MKITNSNWMQIEEYLKNDDRCVLPLGSTEQHAQLSLCVDSLLAENVALEAAEPLGIPVFPVMPFGLAPYFMAYPGTIALRVETLLAVFRDIIQSVRAHGFRRIVIVNGHGGNAPVGALALELMTEFPDTSIKFHNWYNAPKTWAKVQSIDPKSSHASWMENFPLTRLDHAKAPEGRKELVDYPKLRASSPAGVRELIGDGNMGGPWQLDDETMAELWKVGVEETREVLEGPWPTKE
jgi:creatinine amidohydrolase